MTSLAFTNVASTSFTVTAATNEAGTCKRAIDTVNDNTVSDTLLVTVGASSGGTCSANVTGLTASTAYEAKMCVTDAAGNTGCTAVGDQTTSGAGTTFYVSPSGNDSNPGTTGSPWKTLGKGLQNMAPGRTLILKDGTYTASTTGLLHMRCSNAHSAAPGSPYAKGTSSGRITIKAENRYGAKISGSASYLPGYLEECHYWTVQDIFFEQTNQGDMAAITGISTYVVFHAKSTDNFIVRRNLFVHLWVSGEIPASNVVVHYGAGWLLEDNEVYGSSRHIVSLKWMHSGTVRGNYVNDMCASLDPDGEPKSGITLYPASNLIVENNIVESPCGGMSGAFDRVSYGNVDDPTKFKSNHNKHYGNIAIGALNCVTGVSERPANNPASFPEGTLFQDHLCLGDVTGHSDHDTHGYIVYAPVGVGDTLRRMSSFDMDGHGINMTVKTAWSDTPAYRIQAEDLLAVGNGGEGIRVSSRYDVWSIDGAQSFGNGGVNFRATASGSCSPNCTGTSTADPNLGTKRVWHTNPNGAKIIHRYRGGVIQSGENLWTPTPPTGWSGTSYNYYFVPCGPIKAGRNDHASRSCASLAARLGLTTSNLSGAPGY